MNPPYFFIVDTNSYMVFAHEFCAFITGQDSSDAGIGESEALLFKNHVKTTYHNYQELLKEARQTVNYVKDEDDSRLHWPCEMYATPGRVQNVYGQLLNENEKIEGTQYWPAYESLAINLKKIPSDTLLTIFQQRAYEFPLWVKQSNHNNHNLKNQDIDIHGIKILERSTGKIVLNLGRE
jgi:hypothetical protein